MALRIEQSDWIIHRGTLKKQVGYIGLLDADSEHVLQIHIDTSPNAVIGGIHKHVCFLLHPNPFRGDPGFVPAQLARDDSPIDAKIVLAQCGSCDDGSAIIQTADDDSTQAFLATLEQCVMMRLTLFSDHGAFLKLPIPNDEQYRDAAKAYFASVERVAFQDSMVGSIAKQPSLVTRLASKLFG